MSSEIIQPNFDEIPDELPISAAELFAHPLYQHLQTAPAPPEAQPAPILNPSSMPLSGLISDPTLAPELEIDSPISNSNPTPNESYLIPAPLAPSHLTPTYSSKGKKLSPSSRGRVRIPLELSPDLHAKFKAKCAQLSQSNSSGVRITMTDALIRFILNFIGEDTTPLINLPKDELLSQSVPASISQNILTSYDLIAQKSSRSSPLPAMTQLQTALANDPSNYTPEQQAEIVRNLFSKSPVDQLSDPNYLPHSIETKHSPSARAPKPNALTSINVHAFPCGQLTKMTPALRERLNAPIAARYIDEANNLYDIDGAVYDEMTKKWTIAIGISKWEITLERSWFKHWRPTSWLPHYDEALKQAREFSLLRPTRLPSQYHGPRIRPTSSRAAFSNVSEYLGEPEEKWVHVDDRDWESWEAEQKKDNETLTKLADIPRLLEDPRVQFILGMEEIRRTLIKEARLARGEFPKR